MTIFGNTINPAPGSYILIMQNQVDLCITIGKRGMLSIFHGYYLYVGSAFGPGGISARVRHHSRIQDRPHWHIDYLRKHTRLTEIWFSYDQIRREHQWASLLKTQDNVSVPMPGFGATDCNCSSHLLFCSSKPDFNAFITHTYNSLPDHKTILRQPTVAAKGNNEDIKTGN